MTVRPGKNRPPEVPVDEWGARVAQVRRSRGMGQRALASAVGVGQQSISKLECGEACPRDWLKLRLARALNVPPEVLFPWPPIEGVEPVSASASAQ